MIPAAGAMLALKAGGKMLGNAMGEQQKQGQQGEQLKQALMALGQMGGGQQQQTSTPQAPGIMGGQDPMFSGIMQQYLSQAMGAPAAAQPTATPAPLTAAMESGSAQAASPEQVAKFKAIYGRDPANIQELMQVS